MSRFLLLLVFFAWMSCAGAQPTASSRLPPPGGPTDLIHPIWFLTGYAVLILIAGLWSRGLSRHVDGENLGANLKRFNRVFTLARMIVPVWFFIGVCFMGWGALINGWLVRLGLHPDRLDTPGLLLGCLPALIAWMGLWWAQYPADICFREQGLLAQLDAGLPIHRPPTLRSYLLANLRLQLLFTVAPVLALVILKDLVALGLAPFGMREEDSIAIQLGVSLLTAAVVLLFAPELLRRVLQTEPMPDGPLRQRLEAACRRHRIRYKDVLLWRTDFNMGNAAVMGLIPRTRYILMSDLLLETMTDEQIEAVFAHEIGHIIHRHMLWFAVFFAAMMFAMVGASDALQGFLDRWSGKAIWPSAVGGMAGAIGCLSLFLFLSRKFERQADVFAARTIEEDAHVGPRGAMVFSSALHQVARINCIPVTAWSWCHGSIAKRMDYLQDLSQDPLRTVEFDRFMSRLYALLMISLCGFGLWAMTTLIGQRGG
jgi:STE24 endopeptidase